MRWHESQDAVVGRCVADLPLADVPLWQLAQVPAAPLLWLKVAGTQPEMRWQVSHDAVVGTWVLPCASAPEDAKVVL